MKRTVTRESAVKLGMSVLLLLGLFLFAPTLSQAQTKLDESVPAGPYVSVQDAITRIEQHVDIIKPQIEFMSPGTQEARNLLARIDFYLDIIDRLQKGNTVQASIQGALNILSSDQHSTISKVKQLEYKQEAIDLLKA